MSVEWLRALSAKGGKGTVNNIDARALGLVANEIERLRAVAAAARAVFEGPFEREDTEWCDALFSELELALAALEAKP